MDSEGYAAAVTERPVLVLDGEQLTLEDVLDVAVVREGEPPRQVVLSAGAGEGAAGGAGGAQVCGRGEIVYATTGFGAFKNRIIPASQVAQLQRNILMSHAVGVGEALDQASTRAMMLIRANTLAKGHSGIREETLLLLLAMLNRGVHPVIPCQGSLGASGDLAPLAHMALPLIGLRKRCWWGRHEACNEWGGAVAGGAGAGRVICKRRAWR
jgi:histidine ammonia-lyase